MRKVTVKSLCWLVGKNFTAGLGKTRGIQERANVPEYPESVLFRPNEMPFLGF